MTQGFLLPVHYTVDNIPLLGGRLAKVDSCGLDALVSHEVSKKCDVVTAIQKVLRKTMAKRVRIYDGRIDPIFAGQIFQLA